MKIFGERNEIFCNINKPAGINLSPRGFTLVEIMVAVVILSIGLLAVASMQVSAVNTTASANSTTEATNLAQIKLEELMALQYAPLFTDPDLICDAAIAGAAEPYTDSNGNEIWDFGEPYVDSNSNGIWDAAHVDLNPPPGYIITWSVIDNRPIELAKYIRIYVTQKSNKKTILFTCIKSQGKN